MKLPSVAAVSTPKQVQATFFQGVTKSATFNETRTRRLLLERHWDRSAGHLLFIGLNPSTADEHSDDPTIKRLVGFARSWGLGGLVVCNLFTQVTPYPHMLREDCLELDLTVLVDRASLAAMILVGWGANTRASHRGEKVWEFLSMYRLLCLGTNQDGSPKHPLYIAAKTKPVPWARGRGA